MAIASRLKSLTDILVRDAIRIYQEQQVDFESRWFTTVNLLKEKGQLSVMEVAKDLNMTHPAVNQICNILEKKGLVTSLKDKDDKRKRLLMLSEKGNRLTHDLAPLWKQIEAAVTNLFFETQPDFLNILEDLETALDRKSMYERIRDQVRRARYEEIKIIHYQPRFKDDFRNLNYEWLNKYFEVEAKDDRILMNPEKIVEDGGMVIFARLEGNIVGTTALLHLSNHECELTKMAVKEEYQGRQVGKKMLDYLITHAKKRDYHKMVLYTSPKLRKALGLYKAKGFKTPDPVPAQIGDYKRPSIKMELVLSLANQMFMP